MTDEKEVREGLAGIVDDNGMTTITISLDVWDMWRALILAHENDITFNVWVQRAIRAAMDEQPLEIPDE
jgi:hypothetical protein